MSKYSQRNNKNKKAAYQNLNIFQDKLSYQKLYETDQNDIIKFQKFLNFFR